MPEIQTSGISEVPVTEGEVTAGNVTIGNEQKTPIGGLEEALGLNNAMPQRRHVSNPDVVRQVEGDPSTLEMPETNELQRLRQQNADYQRMLGEQANTLGHENKQLRAEISELRQMVQGQQAAPPPAQQVTFEDQMRGLFGADADPNDEAQRAQTQFALRILDATERGLEGRETRLLDRLGPAIQQAVSSAVARATSGVDDQVIEQLEQRHSWFRGLTQDQKWTAAADLVKGPGSSPQRAGGRDTYVAGPHPIDTSTVVEPTSSMSNQAERVDDQTRFNRYRGLKGAANKKAYLQHALANR